jgi:subtilase family serine protease
MGRQGKLVQVLAVGVAAAGSPVVLGAATAVASSPRVAVGAGVRLPLGARFGTSLPPARRLRLTIALTPRDPPALGAFATAVSTPGRSQYGHYLSVAQFARRFGATASRVAAVSRVMRAAGLRVGAPTANHLAIPVSGTVAQVQTAFAVREARVRLPGGRSAFANDRAPRLAAAIAPSVQAVLGLDDIAREQPQELTRVAPLGRRVAAARPHAVGSGPAPCAAAASVATNSYTADEIASAYGMGSYYPSDEGAGQTVALVEFEAYDPNDIATYQQCYGTSASVANVDVQGGPGAFNGDDGEAALDIEQVIGLAPKASIRVYQAPGNASQAAVLNAIASQDVAKVVSSSWGACEALTGATAMNAENTILQEMATQGQSFFNSSGDSGSTMCYQTTRGAGASQDNGLSVIDPASQPFATGVGGTFLGRADGTTPTDGSYAGEAVWNDGGADAVGDPASGTGGGASLEWTMPSYQSGAAAGLGVVQANSSRACAGQLCRQVPDISADADPQSGYVVWLTDPIVGSGWMIAGGTSASAPLWAAFTALANSSPACRGFGLGFVNPALYAVAGSAYAANFHDVTAPSPVGIANDPGTNDTWSDNPDNPDNHGDLYPVLSGYDMATGLGSPIANALGSSLCTLRAPVYTVGVAAPGNQVTLTGHAVSLAVHGTDSGSAALTYSATGLPAGLSIDAGTGVISGTPTMPQTTTVTVRATDGFANTGSASFGWTVVAPGKPKLSAAPRLSGLGGRRPKLSVTLSAGTFAPALRSVTIRLPGGLSFARKTRLLARGITVKAGAPATTAGFSTALRRGTLIISFKSNVTTATLTIRAPAITVTRGEAAKIRRHKVRKLSVSLKTTDIAGTTTSLKAAFANLS